MEKKLKVGVLMGGPSPEHEVSLLSGRGAAQALHSKGYDVTSLLLTREKKLYANGAETPFPEGLRGFDVIFIALHGIYGEDGEIQNILDGLHVPYTGSSAAASKLGMDKWESRDKFKDHGLRTASGKLVSNSKELPLPLPFVLKPRASGSSDGVAIVKSPEDYFAKIETAQAEMMAEEYLSGREFTCGALEINGVLTALPVVEIRPAKQYEFFDYEAKYKPGASEEIVPAVIDEALSGKIKEFALTAHRALGCSVYSRSDFILSGNDIFILETNTLPGLTPNSLLPKAAKAYGIDFPVLVETILLSSLRRWNKLP
jgi:D-alanine-D-alanine ligase